MQGRKRWHLWSGRRNEIRAPHAPIIRPTTRLVTIGSCFARELANAMGELRLNARQVPGEPFMTTRTILQEIQKAFEQWPTYHDEPYWLKSGNWYHPFKSQKYFAPMPEALRAMVDQVDQEAEALFKTSDIIVITLGHIEAWVQPETMDHFNHAPMLDSVKARFYRLTVADMLSDLTSIRALVKKHTNMEIIISVSPIPLAMTFTDLDIRVADCESKSRIRAAVSEFVCEFPDVHYFHSYEMVSTSAVRSDFMQRDGRHVHRHAVEYIVQQFMDIYSGGIAIPVVDTSWMSATTGTLPSEDTASLQHTHLCTKEYLVPVVDALVAKWGTGNRGMKVAIYGAGVHTAKLWQWTAISDANIVGIIDDREDSRGKSMLGFDVVHTGPDLWKLAPDLVLISDAENQEIIFSDIKQEYESRGVGIVKLYSYALRHRNRARNLYNRGYLYAKVRELMPEWEWSNARIILFGAGQHTVRLFEWTDISEANLVAIADSDQKKIGTSVKGFTVIDPSEIMRLNPNVIVISSAAFQDEIYNGVLRPTRLAGVEVVRLYD